MTSDNNLTSFSPSFNDFVFSDAQIDTFTKSKTDNLRLGIVSRLDRGFPYVLYDDGLIRAEHDVSFAKTQDVVPAVGDVVSLLVEDKHDNAKIMKVLPRKSEINRVKSNKIQTLAANIDIILIAQPYNSHGFEYNRVARSAVIASDSGVDFAVLITKADKARSESSLEIVKESIQELLGSSTVVITVSNDKNSELYSSGINELKSLLKGKIALILGESGAGKSTLINSLCGANILETNEVRARDDAGRHTTVTRRMIKIPDSGIIIDAPGLRNLPMDGHEEGIRRVFPEIFELSNDCKFRDCTHTHEVGCAVTRAVKVGDVSPLAYEIYLQLQKE